MSTSVSCERGQGIVQTIFDLLARQYEAAKVDEARQGATLQIVDKAIPPDQKSSPKIGLMTIGACFLGLLLGLGLRILKRRLQKARHKSLRAVAVREIAQPLLEQTSILVDTARHLLIA